MVPKIFQKSEPKAFVNAKKTIQVLDQVLEWSDIEDSVENGAVFSCQADALKDVTTNQEG